MKINTLKIDTKNSGFDSFLLTDVAPWYAYEGGKKTDKLLGYTCEVALPKHALDKVRVHVTGEVALKPRLQQVVFKGLDISLYPNFSNPAEAGIKAEAEAIQEVK